MNVKNLDFSAVTQTVIAFATTIGLKVIAALIIWFTARILIRKTVQLVGVGLDRRGLDKTIASWIRSSLGVVLMGALIMALLGLFGVETTSFAALLAGAGLAIGAAWGGLLSNFASGVALILLRPFNVGDNVVIAGVSGTVRDIGMFSVLIDGSDNVQQVVPNGRILSETIRNHSANAYRRVDLTVALDQQADEMMAMALIAAAVKGIPNVMEKPAPDVEILGLDGTGPMLAVRPYTTQEHYWQVYFDTNRAVRKILREGNYAPRGVILG